MRPEISVIVPVYNGAHVLPRTVPAMMAQTEPAEWIFVDDGSADATADVLRTLIASGPSMAGADVRVLSLPENRGRAGARNAGIAEAGGAILVFIDADATPATNALRALREALADPGAVAAVARFSYPEADPRDPYQRYLASPRRGGRGHPAGVPLDWKYFILCLAAVRADVLREVGVLDPSISYGEDLELACRLAKRHPDGLRRAETAARLHDLGDIDSALGKMREFAGSNLSRMMEKHPEVKAMVGLDRVAPEAGLRGRLMRLVLTEPFARSIRRLLPMLPASLSDHAVRYLLAHTLYDSYRAASTSP